MDAQSHSAGQILAFKLHDFSIKNYTQHAIASL